MNALTLASAPEEAAAVEAVEAHHAHLAGKLAGRVTMLLTAADRDPDAAESIRAGLVDFCERELLPYTAAQETALYPAAHRTPDARLLVESLIAEHHCLTALVDALRTAPTPVAAAADARALQVLFEEHLAKDNGLVLPLLAVWPDVSLAALFVRMQDAIGPAASAAFAGAQQSRGESAGDCGGGCGCADAADDAVPELDVCAVPHALRHATVFGALDAVPAGHAMVLVEPHDPIPLLTQIEQRHPGTFSVEYLERGPEVWRLRLGRG
jgi:uncharacterized protein (DUF2249 family)